MCIIAHGIKRDFQDGEIAECMRSNPSGNFLAVITNSADGKHVDVLRCLDKQPVLDAFDAAPDDAEILLHARIPSRGTQTIENVHGWMSSEGMRFCHNGTMHSLPTDGGRTDSESFFRRLFLPLWRQEGGFTEDVEFLIKTFTESGGNKFAFLLPDGTVKLYGNFVEDHGCKFSNSTYKKYTPPSYSPYTPPSYSPYTAGSRPGYTGNTISGGWYDPRPSSYFDKSDDLEGYLGAEDDELPLASPAPVTHDPDPEPEPDPVYDWLADPARFAPFYIKVLVLNFLSTEFSPLIHRRTYEKTAPIFDDDYKVDAPDQPWAENLEDFEYDFENSKPEDRDEIIREFINISVETLESAIEDALPYSLREQDEAITNVLNETWKAIDAHALIMGACLPTVVPKRDVAILSRFLPSKFGRMKPKDITLRAVLGEPTFKRLALLNHVTDYLRRTNKRKKGGSEDGDLPLLSAHD